MKKTLILTGAIVASTLTSQAATIVFTGANAFEAAVDVGTLGIITEPATDSTLTSLSYTVSGLTIDGDGTANDTVTFTIAISAVGAGSITWDQNGGTPTDVREFDYNGGTFNSSGEGLTFGAIAVSGTASGGASYTLNSALYKEVTYRRWTAGGGDASSIVGDITNIANNTDIAATLNDTYFTTSWVGGAWNLTDVDFTVDVVAVPEPGTYALLAGLTGLAFVMLRRRSA